MIIIALISPLTGCDYANIYARRVNYMKVAVVDGQGGGIGRSIVEGLRKTLPGGAEIIALGTNAVATSQMLRAGADEGATGENAIVVNAGKADIIVGVIGIVTANSMLGELTPGIARAVAESPALKILIPLNRCNVEVVGTGNGTSVASMIDMLVEKVNARIRGASSSVVSGE
jgi:NAD(P)-dependent dehydrogenase (short-subunit alcohol dehydrogenase family)